MNKFISNFNKLKVFSLFGCTLFIVGLIGIAPTLYFHWFNTGTAHADSIAAKKVWSQIDSLPKTTVKQNQVTGFPVNISIPGSYPAININAPINPGYYNKSNSSWNLSETAAQFVVGSSQPNNIGGNTFIYGHYIPAVFAYLHLIKPGAIASITTSNGYIFNYRYINTYAVPPTDTSVLNNSITPVLTVQTCSGSYFQNRQMYIFSYIGYAKIAK